MQKTFTVGSVEITVRTAQTIRDDLNATLISDRIQTMERKTAPNASGYYDLFGKLCAHVVATRGLPFDPLALSEGTAQQAYDAYCAWMTMHKRIMNAWMAACNEVDSDDVDEATGAAPLAEDADPNL